MIKIGFILLLICLYLVKNIKHIRLAFIALLFLFVLLHNPTPTENKVSDVGLISVSIKKWGSYWFDYYNLGRFEEPNIKKKLTKRYIINCGIAMTGHESRMKANIVVDESKVKWSSCKGKAYGHMQLLSPTAKSTGRWDGKDVKDLLDPDKNSECGMKFYCMKIDYYNGDMILALAAFNAGYARFNKYGLLRNQKYVDSVWPKFIKLNKFDSIQRSRIKKK